MYAGPFADIHRHGEANAWLEPILAAEEGRPAYDWDAWRRSLGALDPGNPRLARLAGPMPNEVRDAYLDEPRYYRQVLRACLGAAAVTGCLVAEFRLGAAAATEPGFIDRFRSAADDVRLRHPGFVPVPIISGLWPARPGGMEAVEALLDSGPGDFPAVDFIPFPYEEATDWELTYRAADRLTVAGFGITIHAGEFTPRHLAPALECPGVTRIGHGIRLVDEPALLQRVIDRGIVIECCPTSNVLLGAVESLGTHPLPRFIEAGARVVICTDNPAGFGNSIAGEYELAASIGLSGNDLAVSTRTAVESSFALAPDKARLLASLDE